uniref:VWFA domain-containing protein n=1 Tax=Kalanchoe fedtschenkoi TaxID=63787 RepID=A0A7N0UGU5_KALFE
MPEAAILSVNHTHETYAVALRVKAPSTPLQIDQCCRRAAPIDSVAVLDVSGSMGGSKLHMLKRAMRLVISSLGASDRLSIVAFSATTKHLLPLRRMTLQGQLSAKHIVDRLTCGQGSNAGDALKKAAKVLEDRREKNPMASNLLLSDCQDQTQLRRERRHVSSGTRISHIEISVHDFGYGKSCGNSLDAAEDTFETQVEVDNEPLFEPAVGLRPAAV